MTDAERRVWIKDATYQQLLEKWRFEPSGSPWFVGSLGEYFQAVMKAKRLECGDHGHVSASKAIGW